MVSRAASSARTGSARGWPPRRRAPVALYVHFPFCISLCPYCDFVVYAGAAARGPRNRVEALVGALETEIGLRADSLDGEFGPPGEVGRPPLDSLYIGGGTPSLIDAAALARLVDLVRRRFALATDAEITLEANPGPDERGDPVAQRLAGITRISFGAQSLDSGELKRLGRRHAPGDVADAVREARRAGIGSINLDLLYDIPDGPIETWTSTLDEAIGFEPDHLSLYALTLDDPDGEGLTGPGGDHLPTTAGARRWRAAARSAQDEDRAATEYHYAVHSLGEAGWHGYESRHNKTYWERRPYEAVGPGAHAFDGASRRWNAARLDAYLAALSPREGGSPRLPPGGVEHLDEVTAAAEQAILGLRTDRGLPLADAAEPPLADSFDWAMDAELLEVTDDARVILTTRGRLLSNELFSRLA